MVENYRKIDAHSHFGRTFLGPKSNIEEYIPEAKKIGVVGAIASPGPTPELIERGLVYYPCLWEENDIGEISYYRIWKNSHGEEVRRLPAERNPYGLVNRELFDKALGYSESPRIFVMPIHHPKLDTVQEVEAMLADYPSVALKIHGVSTFTSPEDISSQTISLLRKYNKPIVVHTDFYRKSPTGMIHQVFNMNDPLKWIEWAHETRIKVFLTHGARLSEKALESANKQTNVVVGIAPDILLMSEPERLAALPEDYMDELLGMISPDKLLFDIDFEWNVLDRTDWNKLDWNMNKRLYKAAIKSGLSADRLTRIFYDNAIEFYDI